MKDTENKHLKMQEFVDCFATTDFLSEMANLDNEKDRQAAALKWLSLAALHGINEYAEKISISRSKKGHVKVTAEYREKDLPVMNSDVADTIFDTVREISHFDKSHGKTRMALGVRDSSVDLNLELKEKSDKTKLTIRFV